MITGAGGKVGRCLLDSFGGATTCAPSTGTPCRAGIGPSSETCRIRPRSGARWLGWTSWCTWRRRPRRRRSSRSSGAQQRRGRLQHLPGGAGSGRAAHRVRQHGAGRRRLPARAHDRDRDPPRPSSLYGATKVFGEVLGRYYHDRWGIEFVGIRIGWFQPYDSPLLRKEPGARNIWLSPGDAVRLFGRAIEKENVGYALVFGTSITQFERLSRRPRASSSTRAGRRCVPNPLRRRWRYGSMRYGSIMNLYGIRKRAVLLCAATVAMARPSQEHARRKR